MASRLSEESLKATYDAGHQGLPIKRGSGFDALLTAPPDLDALVERPDALEAIQALPSQALYQALVHRGLEDSLDVLPLLSREQVTKLFDYDTWHEDRISPQVAFKWLSLYKEVSNEELSKRFRELDEEYQIALLRPFIRLYDEEEYETLPELLQDSLYRLPCGTLHYQIETEDLANQEFIKGLVDALIENDVAYAYSLLAYASSALPNEQENLESQFRKARLEEDGFVTYEESLEVFRPLDLEALRQKWTGATAKPAAGLIKSEGKAVSFLSRLIPQLGAHTDQESYSYVTQGFSFLVNMLCAATKVQPDDLAGLRHVLGLTQALASLGLEYLAGGDEEQGLKILEKEHPQTLFRAGLAVLARLQTAVLGQLEKSLLPEGQALQRYWQLDRRGSLLLLLEKTYLPILGFERTELLKGLFNRFPVYLEEAPKVDRTDNDAGHASRRVFVPIGSLAALAQVAARLDGVAALLELAVMASGDQTQPLVDLDRYLLTAFARILIGGEFHYKPLTEDELDLLVELEPETARHLTSEFFLGVEGSLRAALMGPAPESWAVSSKAGVSTPDSVQQAMAEFSDLVMRLHMVREAARGRSVMTLATVIDVIV